MVKVLRFTDHTAAVKAIAWSPHQHGILASGGGTADRCIRFCNSQTSARLNCVDTGSQVRALVFPFFLLPFFYFLFYLFPIYFFLVWFVMSLPFSSFFFTIYKLVWRMKQHFGLIHPIEARPMGSADFVVIIYLSASLPVCLVCLSDCLSVWSILLVLCIVVYRCC